MNAVRRVLAERYPIAIRPLAHASIPRASFATEADAKVVRKGDLVDSIVTDLNLKKKDVDAVITSLLDKITKHTASGERVVLSGFGSFESRWRSPRVVHNVNSGIKEEIDGQYLAAFKAGSVLKVAVRARKGPPAE